MAGGVVAMVAACCWEVEMSPSVCVNPGCCCVSVVLLALEAAAVGVEEGAEVGKGEGLEVGCRRGA